MLKPLVKHSSLSVRVSEQQGEGTTLALQCVEAGHEERSAPSQVFSKLHLVLKTLHTHLLGKEWHRSSLKQLNFSAFVITKTYNRWCCCFPDVSIGSKKLSAILAELIWEEMSQCIIHECLVNSIPTDSSELKNYSTVECKRFVHYFLHYFHSWQSDIFFAFFCFKVIKETEEFEKALKEMDFLQGDSTDLLKYARNVNCHFASKKCKDVIVAARKLMTSKMHNTVKVFPKCQHDKKRGSDTR